MGTWCPLRRGQRDEWPQVGAGTTRIHMKYDAWNPTKRGGRAWNRMKRRGRGAATSAIAALAAAAGRREKENRPVSLSRTRESFSAISAVSGLEAFLSGARTERTGPMKHTSWLSMPFAALLVLCAATAASGMYHPTLGRFVQRDPAEYADGMSLYEYVDSAPMHYDDPFGLYTDHETLTMKSLKEGWPETGENKRCREWVLQTLIRTNLSQDKDPAKFKEGFRHYNYPKGGNPGDADRAYGEQLVGGQMMFDASLEAVKTPCDTKSDESNCRDAIEALGEMTHLWQDYFGHAVLSETGKFAPAWTHKPEPIKGDPDNRNPMLRPSSWETSSPFSEHGWHFDPTGPDSIWAPVVYPPKFHGGPRRVEREKVRDPRRDDAIMFVAGKYAKLLPKWFDKCRCCCPPK